MILKIDQKKKKRLEDNSFTGNYIQCLVINHNGKDMKTIYTYIQFFIFSYTYN